MSRPPIALLALAALLVTAGCGDDDAPADGGQGPGAASRQECREVAAPEPRQAGGERRPDAQLDPDRTYVVTFETSCGEFTVRLDVEQAPRTTASLASLVRRGFYDGTTFHRIVPGFVIQGGDPTGTG